MLFTKLETFIAFRYLRSKRKEGFISISAWFSLVGIMLGVATLIIVMSVMNGFRSELVNRILGINGHLSVYSKKSNFIDDTSSVVNKIIDFKDVVAVTPQIEGQALARSKFYAKGVIIRGIRWSDLPAKKLLWNSLSLEAKKNYKNNNHVLIGYRLAQKLGVKVGDKLSLLSANGLVTVLGIIPQKHTVTIGGFFDVGMYEYDNNFIFMPWEIANVFLLTKEKFHNIEVFLTDHNKSSEIKKYISDSLEKNLLVLDWKSKNSTFINALNIEKNVMFIILSLIILVATFNIISSMTMLVNTKTSDISLLRAMGATKLTIIKIFLLVGTSIGFIGTFIGSMLGIYLSLNIEGLRKILSYIFKKDLFSPEVYFLSKLPSEIHNFEVVLVILMSMSLSLVASIFPAWKASKILPAEGLRYE